MKALNFFFVSVSRDPSSSGQFRDYQWISFGKKYEKHLSMHEMHENPILNPLEYLSSFDSKNQFSFHDN